MIATNALGSRSVNGSAVPHWDSATGELCWRGRVVKTFGQPAQAQRDLIAAFQANGWPRCLPNPLSCGAARSKKHRLQNTVKNLNRSLHKKTICFEMDGTGQGVRWRPVE